MNNIKISPIFYMGNKKRLIKKGLIELFPKGIDTFVDVFAGSAIVSMNTKANNYIINDWDTNLIDLYLLFRGMKTENIVKHINNRIEQYNLPKERTRRCEYQDKEQITKYKESYVHLRDHYNKTHNVLDLYTLMFFSFSQQFRFNSNGEFNMPFGNDYFTPKHEEYIQNGREFFSKSNVCILSRNFTDLLSIENFSAEELKNTFFYCDPPYFNTTATYNEGRGHEAWSEKDEEILHQRLDDISANGGKWALSSVKFSKGKGNPYLIDWINEHDEYNEFCFDGHTYTACGKGNSNAKEVLITNY